MADPNWTRWIHASVAKSLSTVAAAKGMAVLVEGVDIRDDDFQSAPDQLEIRVNGPFSRELSKNYHELVVGVNVLLKSQMGGQSRNRFLHDTLLGHLHDAMDGPLAIYRYGTGPDDDDTLLGCLKLAPGKSYVRVYHFGQVDPSLLMQQGMVDAEYRMYLSE